MFLKYCSFHKKFKFYLTEYVIIFFFMQCNANTINLKVDKTNICINIYIFFLNASVRYEHYYSNIILFKLSVEPEEFVLNGLKIFIKFIYIS